MIDCNKFKNMKVCSEILNDNTNSVYSNSVFLSLKTMSSRKKGKYFERIIKEWFADKFGCIITKPCSSEHDFVVDGIKVEVKGSFLWEECSEFKFQQIRPNQDYDILIFLSVYPTHMEIHGCSKSVAKNKLEVQDKNGHWPFNQHGGKRINSGTFEIFGHPNKINWMSPITSKQDIIALLNYKDTKQ